MANAKGHDAPVPQRAIDFLAKKVKVETEKWDDLKCGEHAHAFTVAHSAGAGVLDDIFKSMNKAVAEGESFQTFRQRMLDTMKEKGWYGGGGHTADEKKYINWRIGVIYDTNMRTAYAQANYREQLEGAELRPIWVYRHDPGVVKPRADHLAMDGMAFRYDDPFWDTHYPINAWGCQCTVETESEYSAEKAGIKVEDSKNITLPEIDGTWAYNAGREAIAPNFNKYTNLPKDALKQIYENYHRSVNNTRLSEGEFKTLVKRTNEADYKRNNIMYQAGNLEPERYAKMREAGMLDSKIMATDNDLWHSTGDKNAKQKVPENLFGDLYKTVNEPEDIYEETVNGKLYRVFHFVKDTKDGKKIKVLLHTIKLGKNQTALKITTMGHSTYDYKDRKYKKIW
jgi:uncharacterized protein with gpF-like domain